VALALLRAVSRLISTPWVNTISEPSVGKSADPARKSACATTRRTLRGVRKHLYTSSKYPFFPTFIARVEPICSTTPSAS
jgi:hypothetical protein